MKLHVLCLALLLAGCGGTASVPVTPGELGIQLTAPAAPPGAMVLVVSGGPVSGVRPIAGVESALATDEGETRILLVGVLGGGEVASLDIPDGSLGSRYVVTIEQVADAATFALLDPAAWGATLIVRP